MPLSVQRSLPQRTYFCGDTIQEIYRFRGTSNEFIKALSCSDGWEKIKLFTNYRSTNQICEYANKFSAKYADPSYRIEMKGVRDGDKVITKFIDGPKNYNAIDYKALDNAITASRTYNGTSAILCRSNKEVMATIKYLKDNNIDFTTSKDVRIQHIIDCALSETYMLGSLASYLSTNKYGEYIRLASQTKNPNLAWFLDLYGNTSAVKDEVKEVNWLKDLANKSIPMKDKFAEISKKYCIDIPEADKEYKGKEFLKYLQETVTEIKSSELYVGTIHSVKGLEYDNVFVMNVGSYVFQLDDEEMKNLFYVAITRAKNHLVVYEVF